jgi:CDP-diglyceride synthetase
MLMFVSIFRVEWKAFTLMRDEWFHGSIALGSLGVLLAFFICGLTEWTFGDQEVVTLMWTTVGILLGVARLNARVASQIGLEQL